MAIATFENNDPTVVLRMTEEEARYLLWWIERHSNGIPGPVTKALRALLIPGAL